MTPEEFQQQFMPYAQAAGARTGIDPRLILAQSALETGYGRSAPGNNFFGIKSHGQGGGNTLMTQEFEGGQMVDVPQSFRGYESPEQSFQGYADFILNNPRYRDVMAQGDLAGQIGAMGASGYATDPEYARKLASIAGRFGGDVDASQFSTRGGNTPTAVAQDTRAALGLLNNGGGQQMAAQEQPQGLLGMLGIQKRDEAAGGQTAQPFYERDKFRDLMGNLATGFNSMRLSPDQGMAQMVGERRQGRAQTQQANRTIEWLRLQPGGERFAEMAKAAGPQVALQAYQASLQPVAAASPNSPIAKLAEDLRNGLITPEQYEQAAAGIGASGPLVSISGDTPTPVDAGLRSDLYENLGDEFKSYVTAGSNAAASMSDLNALQELSGLAPSGQISGRLAEAFPGLNDVSAVREAIIKRVAPTLRAEGSGSTSDIEYAGMLNSLGSLTNTPEANAAIIGVMQAKAQFNIDRSNIVRKLTIDPDYTTQQALNDLQTLEESAGIPEQVKAILEMSGGAAEAPADTSGSGGNTLTFNPETGAFD